MKREIRDVWSRIGFTSLMLLSFTALTINIASAQNEAKEARRLIDNDQVQKAITLLTDATQKNSSAAALWYHLGYAQLKNGQRDLAAKSFDKGISTDEKEPLNYVGRGHLNMLENNAQKATLDFDKALSMTKSKNVGVLKAVAEGYLVDSKLADKALALLLKAKTIDDHDPETFILLGDTYLAQNNGGQAVSSYERAASLDPKLAKPHYKVGLVYLRSRNFPTAEESFNKAIQIDPNYTLAHKELGELYYQKKEGVKAVAAYEKYLALTEKPEKAQLRYAFFLFMAKNFTKANEVFKEVIKREGISPTTLRFNALSLYEAKDYTQSASVFEQFLSKVKPEEIEAGDYAYYGQALQKQGKDSLAVIQLEKSIELDSLQPEIVQMLGEAYFKTKKFPEAVAAYEQLKSLKGGKLGSQDYYTVGRAYYFTQQYDKADSAFQKLAELQPTMTVPYLWQARTKSSIDSTSEGGLAKPHYELLIEKASATPEKNKNDLVEAYSYLGYYHYLKNDLPLSKSFWDKVIAIDPANVKAKEALKSIKEYWQKVLEADPGNKKAKEGLRTFSK